MWISLLTEILYKKNEIGAERSKRKDGGSSDCGRRGDVVAIHIALSQIVQTISTEKIKL